MHILTSKEINEYAENHSQPESELLYELNRHTHLHTQLPIMLSGHLQGRILSMFSKMIRPSYVLEIGTFTGYSTLCLAEGLQEEGKIITIDIDAEQAAIAKDFFARSPYKDNITSIVGNAIEVLAYLQYDFDLVFIDADKINYTNYFDLVIEKVRKGGYIISDNVLYNGEVLQNVKMSKNAKAIHAFNKKLHQDNRVENVLLPVRDGLMISRKK